jgi:hypothetical protein
VNAAALSPYRGRWRRWAARAERYRATYGRWLPVPRREPCWGEPPPQPGHVDDEAAERDLVRAYVTAYLGERRTA